MFLIKFCKPELQPDERCETSGAALINCVCLKKFAYFSSPFLFL